MRRARLRWAGHVERMGDSRPAKQALRNNPVGKRRVGRPRKRWTDEVEADLHQLRVRGWKRLAKDRAAWTVVVDKAKALHEL